MTTRSEVVDAARKYIRTPFKKGGRDNFGLDCVGLLIAVGRDIGQDLLDTTRYTFDPKPQLITDYVEAQSIARPLMPLKHGYIAILRQSVFPMHTGIIATDTDRITLINANLKLRRVVEQDFYEWKDLLIKVRDYKDVE